MVATRRRCLVLPRFAVLATAYTMTACAAVTTIDAGSGDVASADAVVADRATSDAPNADGVTDTADSAPVDAADGSVDSMPSFSPPPSPSGDVHQGDTGLDVDDLQFQLKLATGHRLDEDGAFGPMTLALLNMFQTSAGLPTSTVADGTTRMALAVTAGVAAMNLMVDESPLPNPLAVPPAAVVMTNLAATNVVAGVGDRTGTYMGMVGFDWGDGPESTGLTQGSPAHIVWVAGGDVTVSMARVIGTISHNEGPFDAVNSYDAGDYTWGAYQLIGAYRASAYRASEDELANGLAYAKIYDPPAFWHAFQRFGVDVNFTRTSDGRVTASSVDVSLARGDGSVLHGKDVWVAVGTEALLNQIFINAGEDPRIQRTEILGAVRTHFDVLDLPLATGRAVASAYFTSERAAACFLDMELNQGRGSAQRAYAAAVDAVSTARSIDPAHPEGWPAAQRAAIEAAILQSVLANLSSATYAARMQRVLASHFPSDAAGSFVRQ